MAMEWSFEPGDANAKNAEPPAEIGDPVRKAAEAFAEAASVARRAADDLVVAIRAAAEAGHDGTWIGTYTGLSQEDVRRVISGRPLY